MINEKMSGLLKRYADNAISRSEFDELMQYIAQSSTDSELNKLMEDVWAELKTDSSFDKVREQLLYQKIITDHRFDDSIKIHKKHFSLFNRWTSVAASLLLLLSIGLGITFYIKHEASKPILAYHEESVPYGKKMRIELSDGSQVWLNSGSKLKFPVVFGGKTRELYLDGQAYFDVVHDNARPFLIHTGKVTTQVLGTAFDINAYGLNDLSVTVARGKVSVGLKDHLLGILTLNQCLHINSSSGIAKLSEVDAGKLRWMNEDLIFDDIQMDAAAKILERWYNVKILIDSPEINTRRFTASFLKKEKISQVLQVIGELTDVQYQQQSNTFTIIAKSNHKR